MGSTGKGIRVQEGVGVVRKGKGCMDQGVWKVQVIVSGQLPTRTILHYVDIGPDEWFYWLVVVLVGSCPSEELS